MKNTQSTAVTLVLEKGAQFAGRGWGDFSKPRGGEFVFCTAMSGIEESLTDPSFAGQVLVNTVSHVGNTGYTGEDGESARTWAEGLVCRHLENEPSNWRAKTNIRDWMLSEGRFVVEGIDTRELTIVLREQGSQRGVVVADSAGLSMAEAQKAIRDTVPDMSGRDLTGIVTCTKGYSLASGDSSWRSAQGYWPLGDEFGQTEAAVSGTSSQSPQIAVWDFGVKRNSLRMLVASGVNVNVVPATAKADELLSAGPDGILLSNGPGDPAAATHIIAELKKVLGKRSLFAICLGHQLVAHAVGAKTYKMKFGHRGIHHPVVELGEDGKVLRSWITSQNHGFAVDRDSLPQHARVSFTHGDDESVEGLSIPLLRCETVQFHPEAGPGPTDSSVLIRRFLSGVRPEFKENRVGAETL